MSQSDEVLYRAFTLTATARSEPERFHVLVELDIKQIVLSLAYRAALAKNGKATACDNGVKVRVINFREGNDKWPDDTLTELREPT